MLFRLLLLPAGVFRHVGAEMEIPRRRQAVFYQYRRKEWLIG
jgi:hypothetical protein